MNQGFGLNKFINAGDFVSMCVIDKRLAIVPLSQPQEHLLDISNQFQEFKLNEEAKEVYKSKKRSKVFKAFKRDYIKQAIDNTKLGLEGELFVLAIERQKLIQLDLIQEAEGVEHVSETKGDGLGYDIKSFSVEKKELYIEVKTTKGPLTTPFYLSRNEFEFYKKFPESYLLYRVYDFDLNSKKGKILVIQGDLEKHVEMEPNSYQVKIVC